MKSPDVNSFLPAITLEVYVFVIGGIVGAASMLIGWYYKYGQRQYVNRYSIKIVPFGEKEKCGL